MTTVAKIRIFLDIGIVADSKDDPEDADDQQDRNQNDLVTRAQATIKPVKKIFKKFEHTGRNGSVV
jgi:hypothetical protein